MMDTAGTESSGLTTHLVNFFRAIFEGDINSIIATVVTSLLAIGLGWLLRKVFLHYREIGALKEAHQKELQAQSATFDVIREGLEKKVQILDGIFDDAERAVTSAGLWKSRETTPPPGYEDKIRRSIPILTVANLKGGVGKTTLTANLAAFYAEQGKRVLAIDLDFQGSLSSLRPNADIVPPSGISAASLLVRGELPASNILSLLGPVVGTQNARILPAYYDLARTENSVMVRWLIHRERRDVRYFIAELLHSKDIQENFDVILLDSPPRLTTSAVQALAASTHLLVPTILDGLSVIAVQSFLDQVSISQNIWPQLRIAGVVGSMTHFNIGNLTSEPYDTAKFSGAEPDAVLRLNTAMEDFRNNTNLPLPQNLVLPYTSFIPRKNEIGRASGEGLAYVNGGAEMRALFKRLGVEVAGRIGLSLE